MDEFAEVSPGFLDAFVKWVVMTSQPLSVCEDQYFERMVKALNSKVSTPYRSKVDKRLIEIEAQVRCAITALVAGQYVACTTDAWTSVANVAYCSLTIAYINAAWQMVNLSLDCSAFPGSHDGQTIAAKLHQLLAQYEIPTSHVVAAVTDTAANMVRSARFMEFDWHGCMAHMLELVTGKRESCVCCAHVVFSRCRSQSHVIAFAHIVHDIHDASTGLFFDGPGVKDAMADARALVGFFKKSPQAAAELKRVLELLKSDHMRVLQDVVTRWWSTYTMIARLQYLKKALIFMHIEVLRPACNLLLVQSCYVQGCSHNPAPVARHCRVTCLSA